MEKCAKLVVDQAGAITKIVGEISCDQQVVTVYPSFLSYFIWFVIGVTAIVTLKKTFFVVNQQSVYIIERFGRFNRAVGAGLRFKIPFIEAIKGTMNLRIAEIEENISVKSKDNTFLLIPVKVQYSVIENLAKDAFYQFEDAKGQISSYILNTVRGKATELTMDEIFESRNAFELAVEQSLSTKFSNAGFRIDNVLVDNPLPSDEVVRAFNRVIASKREKEAAENEAEAIRVKTVGNAKAEAESLTLKATAYVEQRKTIAEGMKDFLGDDKAVMEYLVGIDWRDTIRDASANGAMVVVPSNFDGAAMGSTIAAVKSNNLK